MSCTSVTQHGPVGVAERQVFLEKWERDLDAWRLLQPLCLGQFSWSTAEATAPLCSAVPIIFAIFYILKDWRLSLRVNTPGMLPLSRPLRKGDIGNAG
jgi:hypothetical protein